MSIDLTKIPKTTVYTLVQLIVLVISVFASDAFSQCKIPSLEKPIPKMNRTKIVPNGYVELPKGTRVEDRGGRIDFWLRKITFENSPLTIDVSAGLVASIFEDFKDDITCTENGQIGKSNFRISVAKKGSKNFVLAKVSWTQFVAEVATEKEKALFNHIVRTYSIK